MIDFYETACINMNIAFVHALRCMSTIVKYLKSNVKGKRICKQKNHLTSTTKFL